MTILFVDTPDATQGQEFWTSITGTVIYDATTPRKSGLSSWKCGDAGSNQINFLDTGDLGSNATRSSVYFHFPDLPQSTVTLLRVKPDSGGSSRIEVRVTSTGVLQLFDTSSIQVGSDGSTLSEDTDYRIALVLDDGSPTQAIKVFLDGVEDITATGVDDGAGGLSFLDVGWIDAPGSNRFVNVSHIYVDDVTDLTDPGDIRVTAKLPLNSGGTNGWDGEQASGAAVDDRPILETTGHLHAGSDDQVESSDIEAQANGDEDLTGATIVGHTGWVWADRESGGAGSPSILVNDIETLITLAVGTPAIFIDLNTSSSYPNGGTDEIGMHSTNGSANTNWYEGGILIIYTPAAVGGGLRNPMAGPMTLRTPMGAR